MLAAEAISEEYPQQEAVRSTDPPAVGASEVAAAVDSNGVLPEASATSPRRLSKRWRIIVIAAASVLIVAVLAIAAFLITTAIQEENEAKALAVATHDSAEEGVESTLRELKTSISDAEALILGLNEDQLDDPTLMSDLESALEDAKEDEADGSARASLDTNSATRQDVDTATSRLRALRTSLIDSSQQLDSAADAAESDRQAKSERLAAERRAAEQAAAKAGAQPIAYEDLFRAGDSAMGSYYRFEGKIIQDAGDGAYRVNITKDPGYSRIFWEDTILVYVTGEVAQRLLEDDIISFPAVSAGIESYTTIFGATVELPLVLADGADVSVTGRDE